jgi:hypothetical protein
MWDLWWTKWTFSEYFCFPANHSTDCSTLITTADVPSGLSHPMPGNYIDLSTADVIYHQLRGKVSMKATTNREGNTCSGSALCWTGMTEGSHNMPLSIQKRQPERKPSTFFYILLRMCMRLRACFSADRNCQSVESGADVSKTGTFVRD